MDWEAVLSDAHTLKSNESHVEYYTNLLHLKNDNATLVAEIDRISLELDATLLEKGKSLSKISILRQSLKDYKQKCKELIEAFDLLERVCKRYHGEAQYYRDKFEKGLEDSHELRDNWKKQSEEMEKLLEHVKQAESERNTALESAEQIQESFINLRNQFNDRIHDLEAKIQEISCEKDSLIMACEDRQCELNKLQERLKNANSNLQNQANLIKRLEVQQKNFMSQNNQKSQEIKKLKCELEKFDEMKNENKRIKSYTCELKRKAERKENELQQMKHDLEKIEVFINQWIKQKSLININSQIEMAGPMAVNLKNLADHIRKFEKEKKLDRELIASLEAKVSELQFNKTSLECQMSQKTAKIMELNRHVQDKYKETYLEDELRKSLQRVEMLESHAKKNELLLKDSQTKCLQTESHLKVECEGRNILENELAKLRERLSMKQRALEDITTREKTLQENLEITKERLGTAEENFLRAEKQCESLQKSLDEVVEATHFLKTEIQQSDEKKQEYISSMEKEIQSRSELCDSLKLELEGLEQNLLKNVKEKDEIKNQFALELDDNKKQIKFLSEELDKITKLKTQVDQDLECLRKKSSECEEKMMVNEKCLEKLQEELKFKEKNHHEVVESLNNEINFFKSQLDMYADNLKSKEEIIRSMTEVRSRTLDEDKETFQTLGEEMKKMMTELRDERKKNNLLMMDLDSKANEKDKLISIINDLKSFQEKLKNNHETLMSRYDIERNKRRTMEDRVRKQSTKLKMVYLNVTTNQKEIDDRRKEMELLKMELENCRTIKDENIRELNKYKLKISDLEEELGKMLLELQEKTAMIPQLEEDAKIKGSRLKDIEKELEENKSEIVTNNNLIKVLKGQVRKLSENLRESLNSRQNLDEKYELRTCELHSYIAKMDAMEKTIASTQQERHCAMENSSKLENMLEHYKDKCKTLQEELLNNKNELFSEKEEHLRVAAEIHDKRNLLALTEEKIKEQFSLIQNLKQEREKEEKQFQILERSLKLQLDKTKAELLEIKQEKVAKDQEIGHLKKKIHDYDVQHCRLIQEIKQLTCEITSSRSELEAQKAIMNAMKQSLFPKDPRLAHTENQFSKNNLTGNERITPATNKLPSTFASCLENIESHEDSLSQSITRQHHPQPPNAMFDHDSSAFFNFKGLPNIVSLPHFARSDQFKET